MKIRHVRALAVFGIALVALTGARGSGGGGCDNNGGSSSSSSGGSGGSGSHDDSGSSGSGGSTGGSVPGSGGTADKAARDVTIDKCRYEPSRKELVGRITVKNDGSLDRTYSVTMKFTGSGATTATAFKSGIAVAAGASASAEVSTPYFGSGDGSEYTKCEVTRASRY
ncbi:hypothetical protein [Streptomyces sp.]|uniref:hypothetical protein n=2 Tax=Streptomyces sp. TaxID=1931 RepID=UPI00281222DB|nr:hypothetical protein [Streptomyces sp.]